MKLSWREPAIDRATCTHQGAVRGNNEDEVRDLSSDPSNPWVVGVLVADGMGGGRGGEIASRSVADTIAERIASWRVSDPTLLRERWASQFRKHLSGMVQDAHEALQRRAERDASLEGMGSTLVAMLLFRDRCAVVHCGDSSAFRVRDGVVQRLTVPHTWDETERRRGTLSEEEIAQSPLKGRLVQVIGRTADLAPDVSFFDVRRGDTFIACSDGVTDYFDDEAIASFVTPNTSAATIADSLLQGALRAGGRDNISVGVIRVTREPEELMPPADDEIPPAVGSSLAPAVTSRTPMRPPFSSDSKRASRTRRSRRPLVVMMLALGAFGALAGSAWLWASSGAPRQTPLALGSAASIGGALDSPRSDSGTLATTGEPVARKRSKPRQDDDESRFLPPSRKLPASKSSPTSSSATANVGDQALAAANQRVLDSVRTLFEVSEARQREVLEAERQRAEREAADARRALEQTEMNRRREACRSDSLALQLEMGALVKRTQDAGLIDKKTRRFSDKKEAEALASLNARIRDAGTRATARRKNLEAEWERVTSIRVAWSQYTERAQAIGARCRAPT